MQGFKGERKTGVRSINEDCNGIFWISQFPGGETYRWNRKTDEILLLERYQKNAANEYHRVSIGNVICTGDGYHWFNNNTQLLRWEISSNEYTIYTPHEIDFTWEFYPLTIDGNMDLWMGAEDAVYRFNRVAEQFEEFNFSELQQSHANIRTIVPVNGNLVLSGTTAGLVFLNPNSGHSSLCTIGEDSKKSLRNDHVLAICPDPDSPQNVFWIGTHGGGLGKLTIDAADAQNGTVTEASLSFSHYGVEDGLPDEVVYGILPDDHGNLWMSTNRGLSVFDVSC